MGEDVFVTLDRILLESERGELGEEFLSEAGVDEEPQSVGRVRQQEQLVQLVADPLPRDDLEPGVHRLNRSHKLGVGLEVDSRR